MLNKDKKKNIPYMGIKWDTPMIGTPGGKVQLDEDEKGIHVIRNPAESPICLKYTKEIKS